ncbi:MAG: translation initiation factor IF-1 [Candidatus Paceibacterota bacterium]|jgi:translation initiation factor IF-1
MSGAPSEKLIEGMVIEALPSAMFRVQLNDTAVVLAYLAGRMRIHHIRVMPGDRVLMKMSPDNGRGIVVKRL